MYNDSSFMRIIDGFDSHMDAVAWLALEETISGPVAGSSVITPSSGAEHAIVLSFWLSLLQLFSGVLGELL